MTKAAENTAMSARREEVSDGHAMEREHRAEFAVAMAGGQIKAGSPCRGERMAWYNNRLLEIEWQLGSAAVFGNPLVQRHA